MKPPADRTIAYVNRHITDSVVLEAALRLSGRRVWDGPRPGAIKWLAERLQVHHSTVSRWISGKSKISRLQLKELERIIADESAHRDNHEELVELDA